MFRRLRDGETTLVVKKSKFIARSYTISSRDDAKRIADGLWKEYPDATHVCYGYIADETGDDFGYYDDGEPSGTAGKPIYSALAACGARRSMIAVVRYFGGIKLGTGGLTRAYREAASGLIDSAGLTDARTVNVYEVECDGETYKKICNILRKKLCKIDGIMYNDKVSFTLTADDGDIPELEGLGAKVKYIQTTTVFE